MRSESNAAATGGGGPYRVMIVDDSAVIRGLLTKTLETEADIKVVSTVGNGQAAIDALKRLDIDVIVLDIEMPVMDGLTALPKLMEVKPSVQVIMASTLTLKGASVSMKALSLGAADYLPKPTTTTGINTATDFKRDLVDRVKSWGLVARKKRGLPAGTAAAGDKNTPPAPKKLYSGAITLRTAPAFGKFDCLAVGSSTGGPQALFALFRALGRVDRMPVFVTQHMPATFTTILAEHLAQASGMPAAEGKDGEAVVAGRIYVAPGDFHMTVEQQGAGAVVRLNKNAPENFCRPAVDPMLRSITKMYGARTLFVMLTGMGQDGLRGARELVAAGSTVIAQDEATSVVWGMPGAVATAGLCTAVLPLNEIAPYVKKALLRTAA
jgi:two-component system chemotaxis response regulator CheB